MCFEDGSKENKRRSDPFWRYRCDDDCKCSFEDLPSCSSHLIDKHQRLTKTVVSMKDSVAASFVVVEEARPQCFKDGLVIGED